MCSRALRSRFFTHVVYIAHSWVCPVCAPLLANSCELPFGTTPHLATADDHLVVLTRSQAAIHLLPLAFPSRVVASLPRSQPPFTPTWAASAPSRVASPLKRRDAHSVPSGLPSHAQPNGTFLIHSGVRSFIHR
jgi:hypothetical protein